MRKLLATIVLSLTLGAGASLPAAADSGQREWRDWSEGGPRYFNTPPAEPPQRQRVGRATYSDSWDDEDARPRRRAYDAGDRTYERRYTKRQQAARTAKKTRRHQIARQPAKSQQRKAAVHRVPAAKRPAVAAPKLAPAVAVVKPPTPPLGKKSLSTGGPRGSHLQGIASYYWQGQRVASGGRFDPSAMTAAHKTLPFGTRVRVTHLGNGRSVEVKINDRGPFIAGRIIDLSRGAAGVIGMTAQGIARVAVEVLGR
jgi:rare lipoprotein A